MPDLKTIAVLGATGAQGGGLARAILDHPEAGFRLRAITRNPASDKAKALTGAGAEVVSADLDAEESLQAAFDGAYGVFAVTNYWEHFSPEKELAQAANIARAASAKDVKHLIWSTLEDTRNWVPLEDDRMPTLLGRYKVPHLDAKGEADALFADLPATYLLTSFYWDNFIHFGMGPQPGTDGVLGITMPMGDRPLPGIAAQDIGRSAFGVFKGPEWIGKRVGIAGEHVTGSEMAAGFAKLLGQEVRYNDVPPEVYRSFGFPGADDLGNMFQFKRDFNEMFCAARSVERTRELNPELLSFSQWLDTNRQAFVGQ